MRFLSCIILFGAATSLFAQTNYPKGQYYSVGEILNKKPVTSFTLFVDNRPNNEINQNGGNRFQIFPYRPEITARKLKRKIIAHSDGKDLYMNTELLIKKSGENYSIVEDEGRYLVFKSRPKATEYAVPIPIILPGIVFIAPIQIKDVPEGEIRYCIFDTEKGLSYPVNNKVILSLIQSYPDLVTSFTNEPKDTSGLSPLDLQFKYLKMINDKFREKN